MLDLRLILIVCFIYLGKSDKLDTRKAKLVLKYNKHPNIVFVGSTVTAKCHVCDASNVDLNWVLAKHGKLGALLTETNSSTNIMPDEKQLLRCPSDSESGPAVVSLLQLNITSDLNRSKLYCFSGQYNKESWEACTSGGRNCDTIQQFAVRYGPQKPSLKVKRAFRNGSAVVMATCRACVEIGDSGQIYWALVRGSSTTHIASSGVKVVNKTQGDNTCGKVVVSQLLLKVNKTVAGSILACYPYNFSDTTYTFDRNTEMVAMEKVAIETKDAQGKKPRNKKVNNTYMSILGAAFGVLFAVCAVFKMANVSDPRNLHGSDSGDDLKDQDKLWNTEPEISKIMSKSSETVMYHGVIDVTDMYSPAHKLGTTQSMFVQAPSSIILTEGHGGLQAAFPTRNPCRMSMECFGSAV